jgi:hypothetical protein
MPGIIRFREHRHRRNGLPLASPGVDAARMKLPPTSMTVCQFDLK